MTDPQPPAGLVCTGLTKSFGGVTVLKAIDFAVPAGSVIGLIGENGAGKSTLSSLITGVHRPDSGTMTLDGQPYAPATPGEALDAGVVLIHQEIRLLPELTVAENIFLGRLPRRAGRIDRQRMYEESREVLDLLGAHVDPNRQVRGAVDGGPAGDRDRQGDHPQAALHHLRRALGLAGWRRDRKGPRPDPRAARPGRGRRLHLPPPRRGARGHRWVVCLRDGQRVAAWNTGGVPKAELVNAMVGREFTYAHEAPPPAHDRTVLQVRHLGRHGVFADVDFEVDAGEVLGIAGLVGAGRTETVRAIAGADRADTGEVIVDGKPVNPRNPRSAIKAGIVMVPEDRKGQGLNLDRTRAPSCPTSSNDAARDHPAVAVIVVSSELEEVLGLSHRVLVMSGGRQQGVLSRDEATPQAVMALAVRNAFVDDSDHVDHVTEPTDLESPMSELASGPLNTAAGTRQEG